MNFASDNWAGVPDAVTAALAAAAGGPAPAYGGDPLTAAVEARVSALFERSCRVFFVATGSASNGLALGAFARPGGIVLCHRDAHIATDECGGPEFLTGLKLAGLAGADGRLAAATVEAAIARHGADGVHHGRLVALSLTQASEIGTVYAPAEVAALAAVAKARGLAVHMDGARFANAVASLGVSPAETTWKAGVDVLSFGLTKVGAWAAEAVVFFDDAPAAEFEYLRKRAGHLFSKSRFVAAQFDALLADGLWLSLAGHANAMAARLAAGLAALPGARLAVTPQANEVFPILPAATADRLEAAGARFYPWPAEAFVENRRPDPDERLVRLVTSFRTTEAEVDRFIEICGE